MGSYPQALRPGGKMHSAVLAALMSLAAAAPQVQLPAGLSAAACPDYPFCAMPALPTGPADFPVPIVNGQAVAPVLNTVPAQTAAHQNHQLIAQQQQLQQLIDAQTIQHRIQQQEIEAARLFGRL